MYETAEMENLEEEIAWLREERSRVGGSVELVIRSPNDARVYKVKEAIDLATVDGYTAELLLEVRNDDLVFLSAKEIAPDGSYSGSEALPVAFEMDSPTLAADILRTAKAMCRAFSHVDMRRKRLPTLKEQDLGLESDVYSWRKDRRDVINAYIARLRDVFHGTRLHLEWEESEQPFEYRLLAWREGSDEYAGAYLRHEAVIEHHVKPEDVGKRLLSLAFWCQGS